MTVMMHDLSRSPLPEATLARWRTVPVSIAVDLGRESGQIDPAIRPLQAAGTSIRLFGPAFTVLCEPPDFGAVVHALDHIGPGEVLVIAAGGNADFAMIGEILGGHVHARGAAGIVCDGAVRDVATLARLADFPVFSRFITPRGPASAERGAIGCPVVIGGRLVHPGDLILGDDDGLVALPAATLQARAVEAAARMAREADWIASLAAGRPAREVFGLHPPCPVAQS